LNGINILLLIARVLRLMDFQPRLGVVTRSLWLAGEGRRVGARCL
jgi:hypothetical protein